MKLSSSANRRPDIVAAARGGEEKVMERIQDLMTKQSPPARREVELTNVPVVAAQAERFRQRLGFWTARVRELE